MKILLLISILLSVKTCYSLLCYTCNSGTNANCGDNMVNTTKVPITSCKPGDVCVTFYNVFDNNNIYRGCSSVYYVPETLFNSETCVLDSYTKSVFCSCTKDKCNLGKMGSLEITSINECQSNPCQNEGQCIDLYNKYECKCAQNFTGTNCNECIPGNTGPNCDEVVNPCDPNPCQYGGSCSGNKDGTYVCSCADGFADADCSTRLDPCGNFPCENGGVCTDLFVGFEFECNCAGTGFEGQTCIDDIDECLNSTLNKCVNGTCVNNLGSFSCDCDAGFSGEFCDYDINECLSNPCKEGLCVDLPNGYECDCNPGYEGVNCEQDIDECSTHNCTDNGKCVNLIADYRCECDAGFNGRDCEINIDECASNPCKFNSVCNDLINDYKCSCLTGFDGKNCDIQINECSSNPCKNGATCKDGLAKYTCFCAPGFNGPTCETDLDECASSPCYTDGTDGTCQNLVNGYKCKCKAGFYGVNCDELTPPPPAPKPCSSNPCKNNGKCVDTIDSAFVCECPNGYDGVDCSVAVTNYCAGITCVNGQAVSDPDNKKCTCECKSGFSGDRCEIENFVCKEVGTFPDPVYCWNYYSCAPGADGLVKTTLSCPLKILSTGELQLLFQYDPATKMGTCKFPSTFAAYTGQTCRKTL